MSLKTKTSNLQVGFTLIEVLIALSILAVLAVIINSSWSGNILRFKTSQIKVEAVELLQKKIIEIETEFKDRIDSLPMEEKQTGTFEDERFSKYSWEWEARQIEIPDISALVSTEDQDPLVVTVLENFRTYLNQSIKEVLVQVKYQSGKGRPYIFSVPFYMVNFDNQLSVGIGGADATDIPGQQSPATNPQGGN